MPDEVRREDHPKLGILGAAELTIACHCPEVRAGSGASSVLVAGVDRDRDCESIEPMEIPESLLSSREDRLEFSPDDVRADMADTHEFLRNAWGIFWVSIAAGGGFLLKRFPALMSAALCLS